MSVTIAPWLPADADARFFALIARAQADIGVCEDPPGSNRGPEIDAYNRRAHVPEGSYWCAAAIGAWCEDVGLTTPPSRASCDAWMNWAKANGRWAAKPEAGSAVLYGKPGDATHIGLVIRAAPLVLSIEGNTTVEGKGDERNGTAVALKLVTDRDPVLGYVRLVRP